MLLVRLLVLTAFTLTWIGLTLYLVRARRVPAGRLLLLVLLICIITQIVAHWDGGWVTADLDLSAKLTLLIAGIIVCILAVAGRLPDQHLKVHQLALREGDVRLRPLTEKDWARLIGWNNDPEISYLVEGETLPARAREEVRDLYRTVSHTGLLFIIEVANRPVGECWLQKVQEARLLTRFPGHDLRRIDLLLGDKTFWGHGYGPRVIRLLTQLAIAQGADGVFGVAIAQDNVRARRAFEKIGYAPASDTATSAEEMPPAHDLVLWRTAWSSTAAKPDA